MAAALCETEQQGKQRQPLPKQMLSFLLKNYLPLSLVSLVLLGIFVPQPGLLFSKGPTDYICVVTLFFYIGIKLRTAEVKEAFKSSKALSFGVVSILFITTTIGVSLTSLLPFDETGIAKKYKTLSSTNASTAFNETTIYSGKAEAKSIFGPQAFKFGIQLYFIAPCTMASGVIMVEQAGGNLILALLLTVICQMISMFSTPALISWLIKFEGVKINFGKLLVTLLLTVLLPSMAGKAFQFIPHVKPLVKKYTNTLKIIAITVLAMLPWMKVSQSSATGSFNDLQVSSIFACVAWGLTVHLLYGIINLTMSILLRFEGPVLKTLVVLASTKSLFIPVTVLAFLPISSDQQGLIALPIVMIHLTVLVVDSIVVVRWHIWDQNKKSAEQRIGTAFQLNGVLITKQGPDKTTATSCTEVVPQFESTV